MCECSYKCNRKLFKKVKSWSSHTVKHIPREQPLDPKRAQLPNKKSTSKSFVVKEDDEKLIASLFQSSEEKKVHNKTHTQKCVNLQICIKKMSLRFLFIIVVSDKKFN